MSEEQKNKNKCEGCGVQGCSAKNLKPGETPEQFRERQLMSQRLGDIKNKILIMSGKGGVGKSTVATNLAFQLADSGYQVGIMDVDIHGPNIPKMLGIDGKKVMAGKANLYPVDFNANLKVISIAFLLQSRNDAVIWRGPLKMSLIKQFIRDVEWGKLDYLVIDAPPGTGDEPLSVCQLIGDARSVIVTTPQEMSLLDVRKSVNFCHKLNTKIIGVIENMSGFICPHCGKRTDIFGSGGGEKMCREMGVPFLGRIPVDPEVVVSGDSGIPAVSAHPESETAKAYREIATAVKAFFSAGEAGNAGG